MSRKLPVFFVTLAFLAGSLAAQPLLPDGEFDGTLGSWHTNDPQGSIVLGTLDAGLCGPGSVSGRAESASSTAGYLGQFFPDCISPVVAGQTYSFGGMIRFLTGQVATGNSQFSAVWTDAPDCAGLVTGVDYSAPLVTTALAGNWVPSRTVEVAPAGSQSVHLRLRVVKDGAGGALATRFDSVYFAAGNYIFAEGFEVGSTCRWSLTSP
jgi:hypothetical protein